METASVLFSLYFFGLFSRALASTNLPFSRNPLELRAPSCNAPDSPWQPNFNAFQAANTPANLGGWWSQQSSTGVRFDSALGNLAGKNGFHCGIGLSAQCTAPSCNDIASINDSPWIGQAIASCQNLNSLFQVMYDGIGWGQGDASELTSNLADQVFKFKDPVWKGGEIINWLGLAVSIIFSAGGAAVAVGKTATAVASGAGLLAGATQSQLTSSLQPQAGSTRQKGINKLNALFYNLSTTATEFLETYANQTFAGQQDSNNKNIIDVISSGSYAGVDNFPTQSSISSFYKTYLFAKAVNGYWSNSPVYVLSTTAPINDTDQIPKNDSWYSNSTKRTYALYYFHDKTSTRPPGVKALNSSLFDIAPAQIAQSAGRAWEFAGNNYTYEIANNRIQGAFVTPDILKPFQDGPAWEGTFNLTVCDVGTHKDWLPAYDDPSSSTRHKLPCCCGPNCNETRAFVKRAHLQKSYEFWDACRNQLRNTDVNFTAIDYGIDLGPPFMQWWKSSGKAKRAGVVLGMIVGGILFLVVLLYCCIAVWL